MGRKKSTLTDNGINGGDPRSPNRDPEEVRRMGLLDPMASEITSNRRGGVEYLEVPLSLFDPPDHLARPVDDGEYMADVLDSMRRVGQLNPVICHRVEKRFKMDDGMHRLTAAQYLGWPSLRAQAFLDKHLAIEAIQLHANQVARHMTPWEEYLFYTRLAEQFKLGFEGLCKWTRKSEMYVSDRLRLGLLTTETQFALQNNKVSFAVCKELIRLKDPHWERYYLDLCLRTGTGAGVLHGWVSQKLLKDAIPTDAQIAAVVSPPPMPPPSCAIRCELCHGDGGGRAMMQVWVHIDELKTIQSVISATFARAGSIDPLTVEPTI